MKILMDMERGPGGGAPQHANVEQGGLISPEKIDYVTMYKGAPRSEVEKIASLDSAGGRDPNQYTLNEVQTMIASPNLYQGVDIPNKEELVLLKKILSARKALEQ